MLKILSVVDKEDTAIDRLAHGLKLFMSNLDYSVIAVHPKRPSTEQLATFYREAIGADLIDWQYFRTAVSLRENLKWLKEPDAPKQILTHHNPYSITESNWNEFDTVIANNKTIYENLGRITQAPIELIPNAVDTDFWTFNLDWQPNNNVIMVANRIESKKGILPVAEACKELGLKLILVGSISDGDYFRKVMDTRVVEFYQNISNERLRHLYWHSTIHVCNSVDNFESGTIPMLEAMLTGVPVLTRTIGHVPDLYNGENMQINEAQSEDTEALSNLLHDMISDKKRLSAMRDKAWNTAKSRSNERRAYMYQKLYRQVLYPHELSVSVVVPVYDRPEIIRACLSAISNQTHKNTEIIVCDDNPESNKELVANFAKFTNMPVRYIHTAHEPKDYGLARARNIGTIESTGEVMVYCDQRQIMQPNAVEEFIRKLKPRHWLHGNRGDGKKSFIENFSCINRQDIIDFGLFSERMTAYGGLSQETRSRARHQGIQSEYVESAMANPMGKSSNRNRRRDEIIKSKNTLFKMGLE